MRSKRPKTEKYSYAGGRRVFGLVFRLSATAARMRSFRAASFNLVALVDVDGAPYIPLKAGVE